VSSEGQNIAEPMLPQAIRMLHSIIIILLLLWLWLWLFLIWGLKMH